MTDAAWRTQPVVPVDERSTLPRILVDQAQRLGRKALFVFDDDTPPLGYADLVERAEWASTRLVAEFGITSGTSVALYLRNGTDFVVSWFASAFTGCVDFPVDHDYRKGLLAHALDVSEAAVIFTDLDGFTALLDPETAAAASRLRVVVLCGATEEHVRSAAGHLGRTAVLSLEALTCEGPQRGTWMQLHASDLASIRFTSGTTGKAKGIMHSHLHMLGKSMAINRILGATDGDVLYSPFPLHHNLASINGFVGMIQVGGTMVSAPRFSASGYWPAVRRHQATLGHILAPMIPMLLAQPATSDDRNHALRFLWTARGSPEFVDRFAAQPVLAYALSEVGVIAYRRDGGEERSSACGETIPEMDVSIVDTLDRPVPIGTSGQIVIRPRHPHRMTLGYYRDLPATVRAFRNLWFHTGDAGHFGDDGQLHFTGRLGDTIRRRGVNISCEQLEHEIGHVAAIEACMVLGVPADVGEEEIHLMVAFRNAETSVDAAVQALVEALLQRLPRSYVPRFFEVVRTLPRTTTGKLSRDEARRRLRAAPVWDRERKAWVEFAHPLASGSRMPTFAGQTT